MRLDKMFSPQSTKSACGAPSCQGWKFKSNKKFLYMAREWNAAKLNLREHTSYVFLVGGGRAREERHLRGMDGR